METSPLTLAAEAAVERFGTHPSFRTRFDSLASLLADHCGATFDDACLALFNAHIGPPGEPAPPRPREERFAEELAAVERQFRAFAGVTPPALPMRLVHFCDTYRAEVQNQPAQVLDAMRRGNPSLTTEAAQSMLREVLAAGDGRGEAADGAAA